jgi:hypothetical protein
MKSVFFILIILGLNYSVFCQYATNYYEGGDNEVKIQLRVDVNATKKDLKLKIRHEDKTYSSIQGTSNLILKYTSGVGEGFLGFIEKPVTGNGTLYYLSGSTNGYTAIKFNDQYTMATVKFYKWDDFYENYKIVESYYLYEPVDGGKILNWLLKD